MRPSTAEDCLEALHALGATCGCVHTAELARWLGVQPALAGAMIAQVSGDGLAECPARFRVRLTARGGQEAARVVRRRRLCESHLMAQHGYALGAAQVIAARLAFAVPDDVIAEAAHVYGEPDLTSCVEPAPAWALAMRGRLAHAVQCAARTC